MKKLTVFSALGFMALAVVTTGCGSKTYSITSGNENLQALTKVTDNSGQTIRAIATAPNSPTIFLAVVSDNSCNIYKKENPTSASMSQITSGRILCDDPAYNPETDRLTFTYSTPYNNGWSKGDIYTLSFNNVNALSPVTQTATIEEYSPTFSPDGTVICYQSKGGNNAEIWTKNIRNNETTLLGSGFMPKLSPDGKKIVFVRYKNTSLNSPSSIWVMNVDGTNVTELISNPDQRMFNPSWSPDGKKIVFQNSVKKGGYKNPDIYVINADGSGLTQLTTNESADFAPVWSADGYIYFISDRGGKQKDYQAWRFKAN